MEKTPKLTFFEAIKPLYDGTIGVLTRSEMQLHHMIVMQFGPNAVPNGVRLDLLDTVFIRRS